MGSLDLRAKARAIQESLEAAHPAIPQNVDSILLRKAIYEVGYEIASALRGQETTLEEIQKAVETIAAEI